METTLNKIRERSPSDNGWRNLLKYLDKVTADDEPLSIVTILKSNGVDDALWCLSVVDGHEKEIRLYAVWCARQVQHLMTDPRSIAALDVAERYAHGEASVDELDAAWEDARRAAFDAATWTVMRNAAAAAWGTAWAAWIVAWATVREAAREAQKAELIRVCAEIESKDKV